MGTAPANRGSCSYCGRVLTQSGMTRHLTACEARLTAIAEADSRPGVVEPVYTLLVRDRYNPSFWLHLEMTGSSPLTRLDTYLRAIWLDCCGHMSEFQVKTWGDNVPRTWKASRAFSEYSQLMHIYDFGTTSETVIRVCGVRQGKPMTKRAIALMARNELPRPPCLECGEPAGYFCTECLIEHDRTGMLCARHAKGHHCRSYGKPIPIVNSPRLGMCGYTGPATPPY